MNVRFAACTAFIFLVLNSLASARPLEKQLPVNDSACFMRIYDAAHLKAHPKQLVRQIRIAHRGTADDGTLYISLDINLRKRANNGTYDYNSGGYCKGKGASLVCTPEWDAGRFTISAGKNGTLVVRNAALIVNPSNYDSEDIADNAVDLGKSDDATWILSPVYPENCAGN